MIRASLSQLQSVLAGSRLVGEQAHSGCFVGLSTDSRKIHAGNLFVALRGERFDAHDFLNDLAHSGAVAVVAEHIPEGFPLPALLVADTKLALQAIATFWRAQWSLPVIGVTGSNGKTTVKEMIASILTAQFGEAHRIATRGNLNNEIGVPLTLFELDQSHQAAVIEMGMNHPGEIAVLSAMAQVDVALVNNAQREHQEFMQSVEAVALENGSVISSLKANGCAVFPFGDTYTSLWRDMAQAAGVQRVLCFGLDEHAEVSAQFVSNDFGSDLTLRLSGQSARIRLQAAGQHNVLNALAAAACCHAIGVPLAGIVQGLEAFTPVSGRLQLKQAANGARLIDDTYNANPDSVKAAIDVLAASSGERVLILGDMGEVGTEGAAFHSEIGDYAKQKGVHRLISVGELAQAASLAFGDAAVHCKDVNAAMNLVNAWNGNARTILVKGSRFMKMERVVAGLMTATADNKN